MNLIDESKEVNHSNKKLFLICGIGIVVLLVIIIALVIITTVMNKNKKSLVVDGKTYSYSNYILNKDNVLYMSIEDLTKITYNGYNYKSGSKDVEDENKCYITNTYESTFFEVNSNEIFKVLEETNETEYYTLQNPIIKENNRMYISFNDISTALNCYTKIDNNKLSVISINYLELNVYNPQNQKNFIYDTSIVWETTYSNKKLLKKNLVIVQDATGKLGVAKVKTESQTAKKVKTTRVVTQQIITPKYLDIKYIEEFNQLIVETENGKGIIQLQESNGNFSAVTAIVPQYEDIKQINEDLFLVSETISGNIENTATNENSVVKYGIVNKKGDIVLPITYDQIGIDVSNFTNNDITNQYILYEKYIPVKKDNLWGFINFKGMVTINLQYDELGCIASNPSNNVLIIPEIKAIVVKKGDKYGIIRNDGKILMNNVITKVYKELEEGKEVYNMIYIGAKIDIVDYIKKLHGDNIDNNSNNNSDNTVIIEKNNSNN